MQIVSTSARLAFTLVFGLVLGISLIGKCQENDQARIFYVNVSKGTQATQISGELVGLTDLEVATSFGEVTIPISKIEAIKLGAGTNRMCVLAFTNGDVLTGSLKLPELKIKTTWGTAFVKASAIGTVSTSQFGAFSAKPGGGWHYLRSQPQTNRQNASVLGQ